ncbi:uncharacterized protein LOC143877055 [Tasmannia lanceolata]|uniref:uncharacterized protein LOC143877055 n=1 Tax=Tasmannia lanceolata TaxID=3420 RepID=UPI004064B8AF
MVGLFSRVSGSKTGLRRSQSALNAGEVPLKNAEAGGSGSSAAAAATHGIEVAIEFKPIEHPIAPPENDQPVRCPLPEPSILNDGRIWKERLSAGVKRRGDLPVVKEGADLESDGSVPKQRPAPPKRFTLPSSISAPEHDLLTLLQECNASGN